MALKSAIVAYMVARWGDITSPLRVPEKDREVAISLIDEHWAPVVLDNGVASNTITTRQTVSGVTFSYSFNFRKSGNRVDVTGRLATTSGTDLNNEVVGIITNTEYLPKTGANVPVFLQKEDNSGDVLQLLLFNSSGNMTAKHASGVVEEGIGFIANFFYYVND